MGSKDSATFGCRSFRRKSVDIQPPDESFLPCNRLNSQARA